MKNDNMILKVVFGSLFVMLLIGGLVAGCSWFDRDDSPTLPAGPAGSMGNYASPPVMQGQYCLTLRTNAFDINFPFAGSYKVEYMVTGRRTYHIVLHVNQPGVWTTGLHAGDLLQSAKVQDVVLKSGVNGSGGARIVKIWGPQDSGSWQDVCSLDPSGSEVVLMEDGQMHVSTCPVTCPPSGGGGGGTSPSCNLGPPNFRDNGDGTVTDTNTGLMWLQQVDCLGKSTWTDRANALTNLNSGTENCGGTYTGTYTDWRVPDIYELRTVFDYSQFNPAFPSGHPFSSGGWNLSVWSDTSYAQDSGSVWLVYLNSGSVSNVAAGTTNDVWLMRN